MAKTHKKGAELGTAESQVQQEESLKRRWSTAFLMIGSALVGATAVAFWNRRTIAHLQDQFHLRDPFPVESEFVVPATRSEEEIF